MSAFHGTLASWAVHNGPIILRSVQAEVPVKSGDLKSSLRVRQRGRVDSTQIQLTSALPYSVMVQKGTKAHVITASNAPVLHWIAPDGGDVFAFSVNHPGAKADDYPGRGWARVRGAVIQDLKLRLGGFAASEMKNRAQSVTGTIGL